MPVINKTISFAMLGPAQSGKTVAGCTIFHEMSAPNFVGDEFFNVTAPGYQVRDLTNAYRSMQTEGRFPAGNLKNEVYTLQFLADDVEMCDIIWLDYKGAMLHNDNVGQESGRYQDVIASLKHAGVLVILVAGDVLNAHIKLETESFKDEHEKYDLEQRISETMTTYKNLFMRIDADEYDKQIKKPVVFLVTKSDLVKAKDDYEMMHYLEDLLFNKYRLALNHKVVLCHCTLGRQLDYNEGTNSIDNTSTVKPEGFEIPLLLTVGYAFSLEGDRWEKMRYDEIAALEKVEQGKIDDNNTEYKIIEEKGRGFFGAIRGIFSGKEDARRKREAMRNIGNAQEKLQALAEERAQVEHNNEMRKKAMSILSYIDNKNQAAGKCFALYLIPKQKKGEKCPICEKRPLSEFFSQKQEM